MCESRMLASAVQIQKILVDPCASHWLKYSLETAIQRDPVDAANDAAILFSLLEARLAPGSTAPIR